MSYWEPLNWGIVPTPAPQGLLEGEVLIGVAINQLYTVWVYELPGEYHHLSIKRFDKAACRDWRHFQWIKNEVCGAEREAVEIFPAESRLLDAANQYHLWVLPEGHHLGIGVNYRAVAETVGPNAGQRAFHGSPHVYVGHEGLLAQRALRQES
jgi:hypothetical protein